MMLTMKQLTDTTDNEVIYNNELFYNTTTYDNYIH